MKTLESLENFMISDSISDRLDAASFSEDGGGASSSEIFCHFTMSSGRKAKCRVVGLKIKPEKIFTIRKISNPRQNYSVRDLYFFRVVANK